MWQKYFPEPDPRLCGSESHQNFCCIEAPIKRRRKISSLDVNLWDPVKSSPPLEPFKILERGRRWKNWSTCRHQNGYNRRALIFTAFAHTSGRDSSHFEDWRQGQLSKRDCLKWIRFGKNLGLDDWLVDESRRYYKKTASYLYRGW